MRFSFNTKTTYSSIALFRILLITIPAIFSCCSGNKTSEKTKNSSKTTKYVKTFEVRKPTKSQIAHHDESFSISFTGIENIVPDSIHVSNNKKSVTTSRVDSLNFTANIETEFVGNQFFNVVVFFSDSLSETHTLKLFILPNTVPVDYTYNVLRTFEHDPRAYTQGLLYNNGYLFESTGRKKQSSIRRINVETGEIVRKKVLEPEFFGEGIAVVGKEIYMITYISQVGFVYDAVTFDLIRKFNLQTKEGWGLTTYGSELILSDGSANLFFFEPKYFSLTKQIEICDNKGLVGKINELEYTRFGLFANVYGENYIVLIDETTGVVKGKVDLTGLFPKGIPENYDHVLNGIAFNIEKETFYVTGKQWPVIYEIVINID